MFGTPVPITRAAELLAQLRGCGLWSQCAHGRPTVAPVLKLPGLRALLARRAEAWRALLGAAADVHVRAGGGGGARRSASRAARTTGRLTAAALRGKLLAAVWRPRHGEGPA